MKAKKPFLLAALIVALLIVALVVPAGASAKQEPNDNKPVNWASHGENTNNFFHDDDLVFQGGHSVLIKELTDESLVGHAVWFMSKPAPFVMRTNSFLSEDPWIGGTSWTVFGEEDLMVDGEMVHFKTAEFAMDFGDAEGLPFRYYKLKLYDGGEPKTKDLEANWVGVVLPDGSGMWVEYTPEGSPVEIMPYSNVKIHLGN